MLPRRPPRLDHFAYKGPYRYFVTCCVDGRRPRFTDAALVASIRTQLVRTAEERSFAVLAYCFMPDHLHCLLEGVSPDADFKAFMKCFRQRAALACAAGSGGRLWQPGYFERVRRVEEATPAVVAYILDNPVRAKLVRRREDYLYSGSAYGFAP